METYLTGIRDEISSLFLQGKGVGFIPRFPCSDNRHRYRDRDRDRDRKNNKITLGYGKLDVSRLSIGFVAWVFEVDPDPDSDPDSDSEEAEDQHVEALDEHPFAPVIIGVRSTEYGGQESP
jgi:hypothetical protein